MTYAVLQTGPEPPSAEQLQNAFSQVPGLTAMDAGILGKDACGVLARGLELDQASAMQSAMAAQGVETEVVEESALPELPPARQLTKGCFTPEALQIDNLLGRVFPLAWNDILLIAAGRARLTEFKENLVDKVVIRPTHDYMPKVVMQTETREEINDHWLLEIITRGAALRYRTVADRPEAMLLFQCLGEQRSRDPSENLCLLVRALAKSAPSAILNHGAYCMIEGLDTSFYYPSQTAFYREIAWLRWMVSSGRLSK